MLIAAAAVMFASTAILLGGDARRLADARFRKPGLVLAGLALQVMVISVVPSGSPGTHAAMHVVSYVLVGFFVAANARVAGLVLAGAGGLLNFAAILANGGVMPASAGALRTAGLGHLDGFANSAALSNPRLGWLGDVFAVPAWVPWHNVFSIGDVLVVLGVAAAAHQLAGSRLARVRPLRTWPLSARYATAERSSLLSRDGGI